MKYNEHRPHLEIMVRQRGSKKSFESSTTFNVIAGKKKIKKKITSTKTKNPHEKKKTLKKKDVSNSFVLKGFLPVLCIEV